MTIVYILLAILLAGVVVLIFAQKKPQENKELISKNEELSAQNQDLINQNNTLSNEGAALKERSALLSNQLIELKKENQENISLITSLKSQLSVVNNENQTLKQQVSEVQETFKNEFKLLSNEILEEKGKSFTELNNKNLSLILNPLKEKIQEFEKQVQETYEKETREKASLKQEINILQQMNKQISDDAKKLTSALKGDSKTQGDWGEVQVERILEKSGLEKGVNYDSQLNLKDEDGNNVRPDFVVYLPENKNFIIDSKVSLTAYEHYYNENDEQLKQQYLNDHVKSIKSHIDELSKKNYQALLGINSPDYVFLYLAVEPALTLALQTDNSIFDYAIQKNIVLVSTTTLLATMRTVSYIWKQENQKKNVFEIANEGGKLYDKFYGFMQDLISVGKNLDSTKKEYESAMNKLFTSTKKGDTIIGRIEHIKTLGANAKNALSQNLLDRINDNQEIGTDKKEENNQTLHLEN
jgi:DNA recombination protein RmuC